MERENTVLMTAVIQTPLGSMTGVGDEEAVYFLAFSDGPTIASKLKLLSKKIGRPLICGTTGPLIFLQNELKDYFDGKLTEFKTPIYLTGSSFQTRVWHELRRIPFGQTKAYRDIAYSITAPRAFRAVAQANATNQLALIIPCHRVINANGNIGGYAGTVARKSWLLKHEQQKEHK